MSQNNKYESLIQSGFAIIVKAFDEQKIDYCQNIEELKDQLDRVMKENEKLREDNMIHQTEIKNLRDINQSLKTSLDKTSQALNIIKSSVLDNDAYQLIQDDYEKTKKKMNKHRKSESVRVDESRVPRPPSTSNYYYQYSITENNLKPRLSKERQSKPIDKYPREDSKKNMLSTAFKLKDYSRNRSVKINNFDLDNPITSRTYQPSRDSSEMGMREENIIEFLSQCRETLDPSTFEKVLLIFNKYKAGSFSSVEFTTKIRLLLCKKKEILNLFNHLMVY